MSITSPPLPPPTFGALSSLAVFADVDGTLLPFKDFPDQVVADMELCSLLERLHHATGGAMALLSGRSIIDLDRIFHPLRFPAAGQHGAEIRLASGLVRGHSPGEGRLEPLIASLLSWAASRPGVLIEQKGVSVAVHVRMAPSETDEARRRLVAWLESDGVGYGLQQGKQVFEVRPDWANKGVALGSLLFTPPFQDRTPVCFGDDETDEDAFAAAQDRGGQAIKVGPGPTCARWRIQGPSELRAWIRGVLELEAPRFAPPRRGGNP